MLDITDLSTYHGAIRALDQVCLSIQPGEIVAIIGANGAGKSTLLNTISGLNKPRHGTVRFQGEDIAGQAAEEIVRKGISLVPERRQIFSTLSVRDNLVLGAYPRKGTNGSALEHDIAGMYELFPILKNRQSQMGGTLSGGEQQMLAIARGIMSKPKLLLLDEPSVGLAPLIIREIMRVIGELRKEGMTVLLVEQNARAALGIADRAYVLENGRIVMEGRAQDLMRKTEVQRAYLGRMSGAR